VKIKLKTYERNIKTGGNSPQRDSDGTRDTVDKRNMGNEQKIKGE